MRPNVNVTVGGPKNPTEYTYKTVILKSNLPFAAQIGEPNCIYVIKWDYDLKGQSVEIPENCVLKFEGGSLSNGTLVGNNTVIDAAPVMIFRTNITIDGTWNVTETYSEWFGAKGDGETDDILSLNLVSQFRCPIVLRRNAVYHTTDSWIVHSSIIGNDATIDATLTIVDPDRYALYRAIQFIEESNFTVSSLRVESNAVGIAILGCKKFGLKDITTKCVKFNTYITGVRNTVSEQFVIENVYFDNVIDFDDPHRTANSDGIHLNGGVRNGVISNCTGTCGDDYVAFNSGEYAEGDGETRRDGGDPTNPLLFNISEVVVNNVVIPDYAICGIRLYGHENGCTIKNITINNCVLHGGSREDPEHRIGEPSINITNHSGPGVTTDRYRFVVENIVFNSCNIDRSGGSALIAGAKGSVTFNDCIFDKVISTTSVAISDSEVNVSFNNCYLSNIQTWLGNNTRQREGKIDILLNNCRLEAHNHENIGFGTVRRRLESGCDILSLKVINCEIVNTSVLEGSHHLLLSDITDVENRSRIYVQNMHTPIMIFARDVQGVVCSSVYDMEFENVQYPLLRIKSQVNHVVRMVDCYLRDQDSQNTGFFDFDTYADLKTRCKGNSCRISEYPSANAVAGDCVIMIGNSVIPSKATYVNSGQWVPEDLFGYDSIMKQNGGQFGQNYFNTGLRRWCLNNGSDWVEQDGFAATKRKGVTSERPTGKHVVSYEGANPVYEGDLVSPRDIGIMFFDETLVKPIYASSIDSEDGTVVWVDSLGEIVS